MHVWVCRDVQFNVPTGNAEITVCAWTTVKMELQSGKALYSVSLLDEVHLKICKLLQ
ncbi:MAG: hypothetical protein J7647_02380 [Cyanobacteria bacterium SBLK]|nr:hypothetical protein [Cyanobacteria bacterium SBLK]